MKNLIYLASTFLLVMFCLTSCQKEELTNVEQPVAGKRSNNLTTIASGGGAVAGPLVLISNYTDDVIFDCCEYSQYTMNNVTHEFFIENNNKKYKITFTKGGQTSVKYTTSQTFLKHWADGGSHQVFVEIVNLDGSYAGASSPNYTYTNTSSPVCIPC